MAAHANNTNRPHPLVAKPRQTTERLRNAGQHSARMATPKAESHAKGTTPAHAAKPHETATHAPSDTKATHAKPDEEPNRHIAKRVAIGAATILALLIACYGAGYAYFSSHFVPGTTVDGMDASNLSQDELAAKIDRIAETWSSHVTGNGLDLTLAEGDVGLTADGTLRATAARAEVDPKRWPLELLSPKQIETGTGVSLDDTRLHATMQAAIDTVNATAAQPTDAYITYDEGMGAFVIRDATIGGVIDATSAIDAVKTSALCLKQSLELGEAQLVKPQLTSDSPELIAAVADHRMDDFRIGDEHVFDLGAFYAASIDHHLGIFAVQKGDISIGQNIAQIAAPIHARTVHVDEIRLLGMIAQIAARNACARDADFAHLACGDGLEVLVEDRDVVAGDRRSDRIRSIGKRAAAVHAIVGGAARRFGGAVRVVDERMVQELVAVRGAQHVAAAYVEADT